MRIAIIVPLLAGSAIVTSGCRFAPLKSVGIPEQQVSAPSEEPKIPAPDPRAAWVPRGYRVEIAVQDLTYPTSVEFDGNGNLFVAEAGAVYGDPSAPARILMISPNGQVEVLADGLSGPVTDLLYTGQGLYVSHKGKISLVSPGGDVQDLVTDLPSLGDHYNNQLALGPDGKIYFGQGTATNSGVVGVDNFVFGWLGTYPQFHDTPAKDITIHGKDYVTLNPLVLTAEGEPPMTRTTAFHPFGQTSGRTTIRGSTKANGAILRMNPDGSGLEVYAWGLRNPFGVAWSPAGQLFATDNGYDDRGSRPVANAPEMIWEIRPDAWYGWPDFVAGEPITLAKFKPEGKPQPRFILTDHPPVEKPFATGRHHSAVCKLDFSRSDRFGYPGQMFIAEVGSMAPLTGKHLEPAGFRVSRLDPRTRRLETFLIAHPDARGPKHLEHTQTSGPRRPVDVAFSPDGSAMYVADIGAIAVLPTAAPTIKPYEGTGVIWRVVREDAPRVREATNISVKPGRHLAYPEDRR